MALWIGIRARARNSCVTRGYCTINIGRVTCNLLKDNWVHRYAGLPCKTGLELGGSLPVVDFFPPPHAEATTGSENFILPVETSHHSVDCQSSHSSHAEQGCFCKESFAFVVSGEGN